MCLLFYHSVRYTRSFGSNLPYIFFWIDFMSDLLMLRQCAFPEEFDALTSDIWHACYSKYVFYLFFFVRVATAFTIVTSNCFSYRTGQGYTSRQFNLTKKVKFVLNANKNECTFSSMGPIYNIWSPLQYHKFYFILISNLYKFNWFHRHYLIGNKNEKEKRKHKGVSI